MSFKVFDCFGRRRRAFTRALGFPARFGGCHQHWLAGAAPAQRAGVAASTGRGRAPEPGADGHPPAAALPGQHTFVYCSCSNAEFVCNWRCSRALDWSAEAACRAQAGLPFLVNQTIITHFYVIFKSLLPVMTVIMVLLLHIFTTL